jgi:hypothetical protein
MNMTADETQTLARHAALMDQQKGEDLKEAVAALRKANPRLSLEDAFAMLRKSKPELFTDTMEVHRKAQKAAAAVYSYVPKVSEDVMEGILEKYARSKVEARKRAGDDDRELMLVMAADGTVAGLELVVGSHDKEEMGRQEAVLEIMKANPGILRDYAIQLAKESNPGLFEDTTHQDAVQQNQALIKDEIARLQKLDKTLTFAKAWAKVQTTHPQWFEEFEAA